MPQVLTGTAKGRKLKVPRGKTVRPTTSRIKKTIFDTLGDISGLEVLDLFAGSGGLGIEALSRGADHVTFIEGDRFVCRALKENISLCGFLDGATLICARYEGALKKLKKDGEKFDLIFIDPPYAAYGRKGVSDFVNEVTELLQDDGVIVIEHNYKMEDTPGPGVAIKPVLSTVEGRGGSQGSTGSGVVIKREGMQESAKDFKRVTKPFGGTQLSFFRRGDR